MVAVLASDCSLTLRRSSSISAREACILAGRIKAYLQVIELFPNTEKASKSEAFLEEMENAE